MYFVLMKGYNVVASAEDEKIRVEGFFRNFRQKC
jgi:hypothetical protein